MIISVSPADPWPRGYVRLETGTALERLDKMMDNSPDISVYPIIGTATRWQSDLTDDE